MLGVSTSTLSRRHDVAWEARGARDKVLRPNEVMRLAVVYRRRSLNEVAVDLLACARQQAPERERSVDDEIERFVDQLDQPALDVKQLLKLADRHLPPRLAAEIRRTIKRGGKRRAVSLIGHESG